MNRDGTSQRGAADREAGRPAIRAWQAAFLCAISGVVVLGAVVPFLVWRWQHPVYDLTVEFGRVFDGVRWMPAGTGIAVRQGRIAKVGWITGLRTRKRLWVFGKIVSPGFIDTHVHIEQNVAPGRPFRAPNFIRMGVTTVITGNCGTSARDIGRFLAGLDRWGGHVNVGTLVGHNTIRQAVLGNRTRPEEADLQRMEELVRKAMNEGALGISTGLEYSPGVHASEEEVVRLVRVAAGMNGIYATHLRNEALDVEAALEEALRTAAKAGARLHVSHAKIAAPVHWGKMRLLLAKLQRWRGQGLAITQDVYLYTASSTSLDIVLPPHLRGNESVRVRLPDAAFRASLIQAMADRLSREGFRNCSHMRVAYFRDAELNGLTIPQVAARLEQGRLPPEWKPLKKTVPGVHCELARQLDAVLYLLWRGGAQMIYFVMSDEDVRAILDHPATMIGSDSAVRSSASKTAHPRGCGNTARLLSRYCRPRGPLELGEALRRLTSLPAETFRLKGRGRLEAGAAADLVVFDPARILDKATFDHPLEPPEGIETVIVGGEFIRQNGIVNDAFPGRSLRRWGDGKRLPPPILPPESGGISSHLLPR